MIDFKEITLADREWIQERLQAASYRSCDYSFGNNFIWSKANNIRFAKVHDFYCLKSFWNGIEILTFPAGGGELKPVIEALIEDSRERGVSFHVRGMVKEAVEEMERLFPGRFTFNFDRSESDYLYLTERLTTLSGKKLHGKRNHIARFKDAGDWAYEDITRENIDECFAMNEEWCKIYDCYANEGLSHELCAVKSAFENFFALPFKGGLLRKAGKIVAYSIGEPLSDDTFVVHIEKAFHDIQGAYPMMNQQFVLHNCQDYTYVNREEDMGDEGLRKAKMSYYPDLLLDKFWLEEKL